MLRNHWCYGETSRATVLCNDPKHVTDALNRAEAWMDEHPDSAWVVLTTLSPDEMGQNRTRARYALLYTFLQMACDYIRSTGMTTQEVERMLEEMRKAKGVKIAFP